jgi:hypothetical protein
MLGKFIDEHQHPKIYYNWFQIVANETVRVHGRHSGDMMGNKELRLKSKYLDSEVDTKLVDDENTKHTYCGFDQH